MVILIAHRGNTDGPNTERENSIPYINEALENGYQLYLGHDLPQYETDIKYLQNPKFLCHAKNLEALYNMLKYDNIHCFYHKEDDYTITSKKYILTYPGKPLTDNSICVMPELYETEVPEFVYGVCTDYVERFKSQLNFSN